jgi:hypothetical protein
MTMFYVSPYITNTLFLMVLVVALYNTVNPWLSLVFFLMAAASLIVVIRQHRMLPPRKKFE